MNPRFWPIGTQWFRKDLSRARRPASILSGLIIQLACLLPLTACRSSGEDLSKIGAATYRGPATSSGSNAQTSGQLPTGGETGQAGKRKKALSAPVEPSTLAAGAEAVGNAFYINNAGQLLTTWEEVRNCRRVAVLDNFELRHVTMIAGNPLSGLVVLDASGTSANYAIFRATPPRVGEGVTSFVHPIFDGLFMPLEATKGAMRSPAAAEGANAVLQTTAFRAGQSAGGPIVDDRGNVLGITVSKLSPDWPGEIGYGISTEMILRYTASVAVGVWTDEVRGKGNASVPQAPAPYAGHYTVPVICFR